MKQLSYLKTASLAMFSFVLVILIISFPKQVYEASLRGLSIWWDIVFPALLPFFITAELMIGFGVVHFLGVILEPFMRPLFRVPGIGGFVMSMGVASGNPMGAKLTARFREQGLISRAEGERLVSITSTSSPLFMFGAVSVGFFHDVSLGLVIALSHYIGIFIVGLIMRFHDFGEMRDRDEPWRTQHSLLYRALREMHRARLKDGRTFGTLIGDAVISSIQTLLMIGGFIIIFSVMINILNLIGIMTLLSFIYQLVLFPFGLHPSLSFPLVVGTFEITLGAQWVSELPEVPMVYKIAIANAMIAWGGLSIHAQIASIIAKTDIRYFPFVISRIFHAIFAGLFTYLLWNPFQSIVQTADIPVFLDSKTQHWIEAWSFYTYALNSVLLIFALLSIFLVLYRWAGKRIE